jgi:hypothetical protein
MEQQNSLSIRRQNGKRPNKHHRRYIQHKYRDHSNEKPGIKDNCMIILSSMHPHELNSSNLLKNKDIEKNGIEQLAFPLKLHILLDNVEAKELSHIVSWQSHGRAFKIHKEREFVDKVMPLYFKNIKLSSFKRQLNHYEFERITQGRDKGAYYHELFLRGMNFLANKMVRTKVKGTIVRAATSPETEPDFYKMPKVKDSSASPLASSPNGEMYLDLSTLGNDTPDDEVKDCNDEEMCALIEQLQNPLDFSPERRDTLSDEWISDNISLESERSDQLMHIFSRQECLFMCTFLEKKCLVK